MARKGGSGRSEGSSARSAKKLVAEVDDVLGRFTVLDRSLSLDGKLSADLVGVDPERRLVLVLVHDAEGAGSKGRPADALTLSVLDALAWARSNRELLARHLDATAFDSSAPPRVVVAGESLPPVFLQRIAVLCPDPVLVLERRRLASATSRSSFLVPASASGEPAGAPSPGDYLDGLDDAQARRAGVVLRRLARVDEDLACTRSRSGLRWSLRGAELCEVVDDAEGAGLVGRVAGQDGSVALEADESVEGFLDAALGRYLELTAEPEASR